MLWIDKYQPRTLDALTCNADLTKLLQRITRNQQIPHLLVYGASGAGKNTRIMAVLRALFGESIDRVKAETITPEGVQAEFVCTSSLYHTQIATSELGTKDRVCVQYMIKQLAAQAPATCYTVQGQSTPKYRVFVLQEAEKLTAGAQAGLRRTLEKYVRNARVILHCQQLSSIIQPLRSRCLCIRVPLATEEEIFTVLKTICHKENITTFTDGYVRDIIRQSERNLRRAVLMLEVAAMHQFPPVKTLSLPWQAQCAEIVEQVLKSQGMGCLLTARELLYELLTSLIPADLILLTLCKYFVQSSPSQELQFHYTRAASHYAYTLKIGTKEIWHLEAFVAQCINFYKQHLSQCAHALN